MPLFKDSSLFDCCNYRPISVLPILSKILEHHVHISFYNILTGDDLLSDSQFGFRKSRSCKLAVTDLINRLLNNMDNRVLNGYAKLLGVTLDCHLTWKKHIDNIYSIVNSRLSLLRRIKPFLNHPCALRFFNSCVHNLFVYCSSAWGNSSYLLSYLLHLQKCTARLLLDGDFSQSSVSLLSKLKWLPIFDFIKRKLVPLFAILNNPDALLCLKGKFHFLSSVYSTGLCTRACTFNLQVAYPHSNSGKHTFAYSAATLLNGRDTDFKQAACVPPSSIIFLS